MTEINKFLKTVVIAKRGRQLKELEAEASVDQGYTNPLAEAIEEYEKKEFDYVLHDESKILIADEDDALSNLYDNLKIKENVPPKTFESDEPVKTVAEPSISQLAAIENETSV
jgi:DNA-directed RNA polymerase subunit K/omega